MDINFKKASYYFNNMKFSKPLNIIVKKQTASTNLDAKLLGSSEKNDFLIIALSQTAGRGRLGRKFYSPSDTGLYMSLLLHPNLTAEEITFLTSAAAVATAKAIESATSVKTEIKWVNDIYQNEKKVCGILSEAAFSAKNTPLYTVIGIGINLTNPKDGFPKDISDIAASIFGNSEINYKTVASLTENIVNTLLEYCYGDIKAHIKEYQMRSMLTGKKVTFTKENQILTATVTGIDNNCRLLLKTASGEEIFLNAGEVSVRPV